MIVLIITVIIVIYKCKYICLESVLGMTKTFLNRNSIQWIYFKTKLISLDIFLPV